MSNRCLVIAEVAQAHDGSLGMAHAFIDAIAKTGADGVKFQTHIASAESSPDEPWRIKFSKQDETRFDYWKRMEFTPEQWHGLKEHANERGLLFLSSPFSFAAIELLEKVGVWAWKVASGEVNNLPMLDRMLASAIPMILSSGMSTVSELDEAILRIKQANRDLTILQCTTSYPCPPEKIGLNMLQAFRERYDCKVGLSDHSGMIFPSLSAATLGANLLEVHVTFSRDMFGPDVPASVTISELELLVQGVRFIERMLANPVDKDEMADNFSDLRDMFTKSIVVNQDLLAGTVIRQQHLAYKKPGTGISASKVDEIIGRRLVRDVWKDSRLSEDDLED